MSDREVKVVKVFYQPRPPKQKTTKMVEILETCTFRKLEEDLDHHFKNHQQCSLFWRDADGDDILISSNKDLALFFSESCDSLKLFYRMDPDVESESRPVIVSPTINRPLVMPSPKPQGNVRSVAMPKLNARFVKHTTCDDESSIYAPGQEFFKTWRFRNDGGLKWPKMIHLLFVSKLTGDSMGGPEDLPIFFPEPIELNAEVDISVPLIAPEKSGEYTGFWKLADETGKKFGQRVRVRIHVTETIPETKLTHHELNVLQYLVEDGYENAKETIKCILHSSKSLLTADNVIDKLSQLGIRMKI